MCIFVIQRSLTQLLTFFLLYFSVLFLKIQESNTGCLPAGQLIYQGSTLPDFIDLLACAFGVRSR